MVGPPEEVPLALGGMTWARVVLAVRSMVKMREATKELVVLFMDLFLLSFIKKLS
jgi:hypothetical protein